MDEWLHPLSSVGKITYPFPNFSSAADDVCEWIGSFIPHFTEHVITWYNLLHCVKTMSQPVPIPLNTWRDNNVVITTQRRHFDVITSKWRRFDVITTSLLRDVSAGMLPFLQGPLLLAWIDFNPSMDKYHHYKVWDEITYPFPNQRYSSWSLGMDK